MAKKRKHHASSILQDEKVCYLTGREDNLEKHHIYYGIGYRELSEEYGCWVWLTGEVHNKDNHSVHFNRELDLRLKRECQAKFEETHTRQEFMTIFGRNYL